VLETFAHSRELWLKNFFLIFMICADRPFFLWHNPTLTGTTFAAINLFFYLITFGRMTVITLSSYICLFVLALSFAFLSLRRISNQSEGSANR
jgi:hypothetical protein